MRAPDGSYEEGFIPPAMANTSARNENKPVGNLDTNNPLSLHDEVSGCVGLQHIHNASLQNPWKEWFLAVELRKTILQDVERTLVDLPSSSPLTDPPTSRFPDIPFFRDPAVQHRLTNVLYLHCVTHPSIGYRQGTVFHWLARLVFHL